MYLYQRARLRRVEKQQSRRPRSYAEIFYRQHLRTIALHIHVTLDLFSLQLDTFGYEYVLPLVLRPGRCESTGEGTSDGALHFRRHDLGLGIVRRQCPACQHLRQRGRFRLGFTDRL